jgi:hypothetical protein
MSTILDFQIKPLPAESYSLTVCERGSSQPLASATFSHRVDFLTDFSVDRLNASTKDAAERFDELQKLGRELYRNLFPPAVEQVWREYKQRGEFLTLCLRFAEGLTDLEELKTNLRMNCIPETILSGDIQDYDAFLEQRRKLMAAKIKAYFQTL